MPIERIGAFVQRIKPRLKLATCLLVVSLSLLSIVSAAGNAYWLFDLASHFRQQYIVLLGMLLPVIIAMKEKKVTMLGATALCLNAIEVAPFYFSQGHALACKNSESLRILSINVNYLNRNFDSILGCIQKFNPDIVAIEELTPELNNELCAKLSAYKFRCAATRRDPFGIGVFSRIPTEHCQVRYFSQSVPSIEQELFWQNKPVLLIVTHPLAPMSPGLAASNKEQLKAIADEITKRHQTSIVIGDLNATEWCSSYKAIVSNANLVDTSKGYGLQPSWLRIFPPLCLTIDHCLTTPDMVTATHLIGPDVGSDHSPLYVELQRSH
jgi:endonuclease/exonuclease/phosphatase (EEP) superfamily protein YafD